MNRLVEVKKGDRIIFKASTGKGSVVRTENKGYYFMPAKFGMRISGLKSPISKNEVFILNDFEVQSYENKRVVKCVLTRCKDNVQFALNENEFIKYFSKPNHLFWRDINKNE